VFNIRADGPPDSSGAAHRPLGSDPPIPMSEAPLSGSRIHRKTVPESAAYESFLYLLAEMEVAIARGTIPWTADEVQAAKRRLANVFADLDAIATRLRTN
jgi:hypothetical protein